MRSESPLFDEDLFSAFQTSLVAPRVAIGCFVYDLVKEAGLHHRGPDPASVITPQTSAGELSLRLSSLIGVQR